MDEQAITVVIPNWNGISLIRDCLHSLERQTLTHTVIVVDNGSTDGSNEVVRNEFPRVKLLEFPNNAGFAGGVNRGIRTALPLGTKYIALLNNDAVADEHWLEELVAVAEEDHRIGAVAAKIVTMDGERIDSTGDFYSIWGFAFPRGRGEIDLGQYDSIEMSSIFSASGGASLYRAQMLQEIGLFDERFFAYLEDVDIGFRARLAGWKIHYAFRATVRHHIGATSSRMDISGMNKAVAADPLDEPARANTFARYHTVKNFNYLYTKNMPGYLYWKYLPRFLMSVCMILVSDSKRGMLTANLKANLVAVMNLPSVLVDRWKIQSRRKVAPAEVDGHLLHQLPPAQRLRFERQGLVKPPK